ncbi:hypothetical protein E1B28_008259 [Marasmius oreades]|uniref:DUF300-domain-containing protein n=1 Tax=Marasmius oreades TaxID=181124 RepID=A0A9P7RZK2_9AGAR|nr:uncharacterized protein E1B28_008259 [Marasmius oreades]KAG7091858.1 hypothetical protein E1B28_008259 [Marasmius oreades]
MSDEGVGSRLPWSVLVLSGVSTLAAVVVSTTSIWLQLKNYRKPYLQRMVVRIMVMVPLYAVASFIALFSLKAAFFIDAVRDIYEAFVIYCFFVLLLAYLGGERSLLILMHGRPAKDPPFPVNFFKREIDVSDPYTFLFLKRGILQYVQVKPILAIVTMILKAFNKYNEGDLRANSGYLYVSIVYNFSICLSLYCLAMFWVCVHDDIKPFRPVPKFLCVKGILFFSFWQAIAISILVAAGVIVKLGPYTDNESISLGLTDCLICVEMPFFAIAHQFAFSHTDFIDRNKSFIARMRFYRAFRDAFGMVDVLEDTKSTLRGEGMNYREFEPSEGYMHQGLARERRIRAGLRYTKGGRKKYWLPTLGVAQPPGQFERGVNRAITKVAGHDQGEEVHAPLLVHEAEDVVHLAPDLQDTDSDELVDLWGAQNVDGGFELPFGDLNEADEQLYEHCKKYIFGDYNYPVVDVSSEDARLMMWREEERVLRDEHGAWFSPLRGAKGQIAIQNRTQPAWSGYGAVGTSAPRNLEQKRRFDENHQGERLIDHNEDQAGPSSSSSSKGGTDVRLRWTKHENSQSRKDQTRSRPGSQSQSPHVRSPLVSSPAEDGRKSQMRHTPPPLSRNASSSQSANSSPLPPDAVDLVVEDDDNQRTRGSKTPLKKVYRRGFVGPEGEEGEVEVAEDEESSPADRVETGERIAKEVESKGVEEGVDASVDKELVTGVEGGVVAARSSTPPVHAQIHLDDNDNPWA